MMPRTFDCPFCKQAMAGEALVRRTVSYSPGMHLHATTCPHCAQTMEFRAYSGALELGYTYWAGSMHFEGVIKLPVPGLSRLEADGALELKGERIFTPTPLAR